MKNQLLVTSISPNIASAPSKAEHVRKVVQSFRENNYDVVSLRRAHEPALPSGLFDVCQMSGSSRGFFSNRYGPSFADIFAAHNVNPVGAIVNADTYLLPCDVADFLKSAEKTIIASRRIDVEYLGGDFEGVHNAGLDGLFISPDIDLSVFEDERFSLFQVGAPYWDIVIPLVLSFHFNLTFAKLPILLHASHDQVWRNADYELLRGHAATITTQYAQSIREQSEAADKFLRGLEFYCPEYSKDDSERTIKKIAIFLAFSLENIERENGLSLDVDLNDPYVKSYVTSMTATNREYINTAKRIVDAGEHGSVHRMKLVARALLKVQRVAQRRQLMRAAIERGNNERPNVGAPRRPVIRIKLRHDLWKAEQYSARPISWRPARLDNSSDGRVSLVTP
jgi:hypothetical protein